MGIAITDLSEGLASLVERAEKSVVGVGRGTGVAWTDTLAVTSASELRTHGCREQEATDVEVRLPDGRTTRGKVLGTDAATDVAVVEVQGGGLTPIARRVDAKRARVGEVVLALGRPGRAIRASQRIVGLVGNDVRARRGLVLRDYVEMDRGFPEGFVGGPVVDAEGALVGLGSDRVIRGADLALGPAMLGPLVDAIAKHGAPRIGWLGVAVQHAKLPDRLSADVPHLSGALLTALEPGGPAETAGLLIGDVIVSLDGAPIEGPDALLALLRTRADQSVALGVIRGGARVEVRATVGARKS